ncbi:MAG: single-stranded-DNA-specific exonuclease RecJ [Butyrivibrio sp.]|nr:single-stranded-DNA-specific exonuclease RecJ [Butyrivibrio sp.]
MSKWMVMAKKADFYHISEKFGISPITARLIRNRDIIGDDEIEVFLKGNMKGLHDGHLMTDMDLAALVMQKRIAAGARIRIMGDYDVDGICSSYILLAGLQFAGADVDCVLPDRIRDGYGLNNNLIDEAIKDGIDTIITCDNGIAASSQVEYAKSKGMTVVITDHHEVPFEIKDNDVREEILPKADAVVDPKRKGSAYPFAEICGAVVAYKFLEVLFEIMEIDTTVPSKELFKELIVFAGFATVCDVMELVDENRIIVREALKQIKTCRNTGLKALIHANGLDDKEISCYHFGFVLGPCLNATGRLDSAMRGLKLLCTEDRIEAAKMAADLKALNDSRKDMTQMGVDRASAVVNDYGENIPDVLVIYLPECHESIAGIIAGKIKEKYVRPTIVLTDAKEGVKGSGRSIESYDMYEELSACKDLFTKFGGHKMAAGLSLPKENIDELRRRLNENSKLQEDDFDPVEHIDMEMPLKYASIGLVKEFSVLEPFGNGNPKPSFAARNIHIMSGRIMGKNRNCAKYRICDDEGLRYDMMYFGDMEKWHEFLKKRYGNETVDRLYDGTLKSDITVKAMYYPDINAYQGRESLQIIMQDYQ